MISNPRDPWRAVWRIVTCDESLASLLLALAAGLALTAWLPQMPLDDPVAYARWLSETQTRLRQAAPVLQTLGLFTIARSFGFRALLAFTAACLTLRLIEIGSRLRQERVWVGLLPVLAHAGALVLLTALLVTYLWGRQATVVVQGGERVTLPGTMGWITLDRDISRVSHSAGLVVFVEARGPGVRVSAADSAGRGLSLQQTADSEPVAELSVALTEDRYFAIPEARLVVRLASQPGQDSGPHSPVLVQVYRSPPGELATEAVVEGDTEIVVDGVTLSLASIPYTQVTATFNPGLWPSVVGIAFLAAGLLGGAALAARQLWLREKASPTPQEGEEA